MNIHYDREKISKLFSRYKQIRSNEIAIYTSLTNNYDNLYDPKYFNEKIDYYVFTDSNKIKSDKWNVVYLDDCEIDPRKTAKIFKVLPHLFFPNYKYSIWVDGNIEVLSDYRDLVKNYLISKSVAFFSHPSRNCIYEEAKHIKKLGYANKDIINVQMNRYLKLNYPKKNGLIAGRFIVRDHNDKKCVVLMEEWWNEINNFSIRDQLSFNYVLWKLDESCEVIKLDHFNNKYFKIHPHKKLIFYDQKRSFNSRMLKSRFYYFLSSLKFYRLYIRPFYLRFKNK